LMILLSLAVALLLCGATLVSYRTIYVPRHEKKVLNAAIKAHAEAAALRVQKCQGIDWETACDAMEGAAGARRLQNNDMNMYSNLEEQYLHSDDPSVTYDSNCLRVYRLQMFGNITFPYHSSQLLQSGGNHTMALFIQHGALRNAEDYFCSFKKLMHMQDYRPFDDILIIAPDFNYEHDKLVHPRDAFWNSSKPWGDWRVGAESDPACCGDSGMTVSSFDVLDHMLSILTNKRLFPKMDKISYVGHSAGGQMVQRYAVMSVLAALWDYDEDIDVEFVVANPSSYTYLTDLRYKYTCGNCTCNFRNCTCDQECTKPPYKTLSVPRRAFVGSSWPCYQWNYDRWPYGIGSFSNKDGYRIPYALRDGFLGVERAIRVYRKLHVVYLVGQNDTCNDGLPVCDQSCWKRENYEEGEWPCFRNEMDTRCPAMLQGPCRRTRGRQYMKYLETLYGEPTHSLREVPGVGHNASGIFSSEIGMKELFGHTSRKSSATAAAASQSVSVP
jgi:hypothetical protein